MTNSINYDLLAELQYEWMLEDLIQSNIDYSCGYQTSRAPLKYSKITYDENGRFVSWKPYLEPYFVYNKIKRDSSRSIDEPTDNPSELEDFLKNRAIDFETTVSSSFEEEKADLDEYQEDRISALQCIEAEEIKYHSDINTETFLTTEIKAVIDWLDLKFTVDPMVCHFCFKPEARSLIKAFITRQTGIRHYIADKSEVYQDGTSFIIRLHDVENLKLLKQFTKMLTIQYGCKVEEMSVEAIELSLDFYKARHSALLIALHKSFKYPAVVNRMRIYKTKGTVREVPKSPHELHRLLENGYNLATGDHRMEEFCTRMYIKRTDRNAKPLSSDQHRLRVEVTLRKTFFMKAKIECGLDNLSTLITYGFKQITFTKLNNKATIFDRKNYRNLVHPFGQERRMIKTVNGHKRSLSDQIKNYGLLNECKRQSVKALADRFKIRKNR